MKLTTTQLLKFAGLFTWACAGVALVTAVLLGRATFSRDEIVIWGVAQLSFGLAYWRLADSLDRRMPRRVRVLLLAAMTVAALAVSHVSHSGLGGVLLLVVAGVLPWTLPLWLGASWLLAQSIAFTGAMWLIPGARLSQVLIAGGLYLGYSSFTFVLSFVARRQARGRDELRQLNSELRATQTLLAQGTRISERLRISRDLHDLVGHHLTALSLNLEVACHLAQGKALEHVQQAQSVAKLLLSDVREVVSTMRDTGGLDLALALKNLSEGVPRPHIHLDIPTELLVEDPRRAQVILRCAQEIITNSLKHADAENLWFRIEQDEDGLAICASDDGRGTDYLDRGNGLIGMGERLRQLGGRLSVDSALGRGFRLDAWLPKEMTL